MIDRIKCERGSRESGQATSVGIEELRDVDKWMRLAVTKIEQ